MKMNTVFTVLLISLALSACSNNKPLSSGGSKKTPRDIMKNLQGNRSENFRRGPQNWRTSPANSTNYSDYTRSEAKELHGLFPRLPNPDLCMYVYPHLSSEKATVPGYTSCFALYDTNQYALPGELITSWQQRKRGI